MYKNTPGSIMIAMLGKKMRRSNFDVIDTTSYEEKYGPIYNAIVSAAYKDPELYIKFSNEYNTIEPNMIIEINKLQTDYNKCINSLALYTNIFAEDSILFNNILSSIKITPIVKSDTTMDQVTSKEILDAVASFVSKELEKISMYESNRDLTISEIFNIKNLLDQFAINDNDLLIINTIMDELKLIISIDQLESRLNQLKTLLSEYTSKQKIADIVNSLNITIKTYNSYDLYYAKLNKQYISSPYILDINTDASVESLYTNLQSKITALAADILKYEIDNQKREATNNVVNKPALSWMTIIIIIIAALSVLGIIAFIVIFIMGISIFKKKPQKMIV
jgi:hypothetical protein